MFGALLLGLVSCHLGLETRLGDTGSVVTTDPGAVGWTVEPSSLALGETSVAEPVTGMITLTNTGDADLLVLGLGGSTEDNLEVTLSGEPVLAPGRAAQLEVVWTPSEPGMLEKSLALEVGGSPTEPEPVAVAVSGTAWGATATVSTSTYDFGAVDIGCDDEFILTVTNTGNIVMQIDSVALHGAEGFWLAEPDDLPWTISPYQSQEQMVLFSPDDLGKKFTELEFETDLGSVTADLQGEGVVDEERTLSFEVGEQSRSTIIWNINLTAIPDSTEDQYSEFFVDSLPTFFDTLEENHASYRAAFVWSVAGTVDGAYDYIDDTFTTTEATDAALDMIAPGATGGDNDANFVTLLAAVGANSDWLFEDDAWAESPLSLITVQRDTEASGGSWSSWVSQTQAYKEDPDDLVYHAIAGPVPGGCGSAEAFADYDKAVSATGGVFRSICEPDWNDSMAELAAACIEGASTFFQLEGTPMESSIEVAMDGVPLTEGWAYDSSMNAVVFEEDSYPDYGSTVTIYYWMSDGCG